MLTIYSEEQDCDLLRVLPSKRHRISPQSADSLRGIWVAEKDGEGGGRR